MMREYLLIRPLNCIMGAIAVLIAALITSTYAIPQDRMIGLYMAIVVVVLFIGAGNALNDYFDRDIDKINHPRRPIPSGKVKPETALKISIVLFFLSILLAIIINIEAFLLVSLNVALMISYEKRFKKGGLSGNMVIGWLTATIFLFAGLSVYQSTEELLKVSTLALLAFMATLGREITKDIQDILGDTDRKTLPKRIGRLGAGIIAGVILITTAWLSLLPLLLGLFEYLYIPIIVVADGIFIYCGFVVLENPRLTSLAIKIGMIVALVAFLMGGLML
jgi:geranylgeranylglycerol-phosphate geranylgeranyltransferase